MRFSGILAVAAALLLTPVLASAQNTVVPASPQAAAEVAGTNAGAGRPAGELPPAIAASNAATAPAAAPLPRVEPTPGIGQPSGGIALQAPMTPIATEAHWMMDNALNPMMFSVSAVVFALLLYSIWRFRRSRNPSPSRTSHNTVLEVAWTVIPVLILVWIAVPSFRLLANQYSPPKADLTIKAIGHQWYWEYEYPDQGGFSFDSIMLEDKAAAAAGSPLKLDVDNRVVVPEGAVVKVLTTGADVIHAWAVPSFWVQMDAVPGRINETWFKVSRPGVYFGQCFQLCGTKHGFMPIAVEVVPRAQFDAWVAAKQRENGITPPAEAAAAAAEAAAAANATKVAGPAADEAPTAPVPAVPAVTTK